MRRKRKHQKKERMYPIVKEWLSEGGRKKELCQRHRITVDVFNYWLSKYKREKRTAPENKSSFVPIKIKSASVAPLGAQEKGDKIEIHYPDGTQIRLPSHLSMAQIRILLPSFIGTHV